MMRGLLDDDLLDGPLEITTVLRPERSARPVAGDDMLGLLAEIQRLCQVWGGAGQPVIPINNGEMPARYSQLLQTEQIDAVGGLQEKNVTTPRRVATRSPWDYPAIAIASGAPLERWRPVHVAELAADDPWKPIYAATLGVWPEVPDDPNWLKFFSVREDVRFEEVVPVERQHVVGSMSDLLVRLADHTQLCPREFSNIFLASGLEPYTSYITANNVLPEPRAIRRAAGPNIIVAINPGSVEDVALLWNLRAAHGDHRVLPIGLPLSEITTDSMRELNQPGRATMFGFSGGACHLTSASLDFVDLQSLAAPSLTVVPARYEDLLRFGPAPGRRRSHVALWRDGWARLEPLTDADREVLEPTQAAFQRPKLVLDVYVDGHRLPAEGTMRGDGFFTRFQAGAAQVFVSERRSEGTVEVSWPPSWTCLAAVAQGRGLRVAQSSEGLAAATLIRSLGSVEAVRWLLHRPLIDLVYRLAERSGMSWWKRRLSQFRKQMVDAGAHPAKFDKAAELLGRDDPAVAPEGEGRHLRFEVFRRILGDESAARRWVAWAERRHLVVRGTDVTCPDCGSKSWLPMASLPPPVGCAGCGREIQQPYGPRDLLFTYGIGEPLRRVLETDSLGHVLALHWLTRLFDGQGLVGAHPGVTFTDTATGADIGEADVLLLFADGSLVPVEVKRRVAGTEGRTTELMDKLADALAAPYDVLAVTQPARDCGPLETLGQRLPARPRLLLTDDQLHESDPIWAVGQNPFEWNPRTAEQDADRESAFARWLARNDPDAPRDYVSPILLNPSLD